MTALEEVFLEQLDLAIDAEEAATGFPVAQWMTSGAKGCQDRAWWQANGPGIVRNFTDWYESHPEVSVWITPDGQPAIELDLTVEFGKVEVKMILDLVLVIGSALVVVDLKSGARTPDSLNQLAMYACGIELAYGVRPKYGTFFMLKGVGKSEEDKKYFLTPTVLDDYQYSIEFWTRQLRMFNEAVCNDVFIANVGDQCKRCGVAYACSAVGGKKAFEFDPGFREEVSKWQTRTRAV